MNDFHYYCNFTMRTYCIEHNFYKLMLANIKLRLFSLYIKIKQTGSQKDCTHAYICILHIYKLYNNIHNTHPYPTDFHS